MSYAESTGVSTNEDTNGVLQNFTNRCIWNMKKQLQKIFSSRVFNLLLLAGVCYISETKTLVISYGGK